MQPSVTLQRDTRLSLSALPALIGIYLIGHWAQALPAASIMAGGALTIGFASNRTLKGSTLAFLALTLFGLMLSSFAGCLAGNVFSLYVCGAVLFAGLYTVTFNTLPDIGWMFQQCAIAYLVSGYFAGSGEHALDRSLLIAAGGGLQIGSIALINMQSMLKNPGRPPNPLRGMNLKRLHFNIHLHIRYATLCGMLAMAAALILVHQYQLSNGYWAGMTILICLKNHFHDTRIKVQARVLGTLAGSLLAGETAEIMHSMILAQGLFVLFACLAMRLSYSLDKHSYFIFSFFITVMVIFMIAGSGAGQTGVALHRFAATLIGGIIAILAITGTLAFRRRHSLHSKKAPHQSS